MLIDSHCHLHDSEFFGDERERIYQEAITAGIVSMLCVGTDARSSQEAVAWAATHEGCYAVVGVHPHEAKNGIEGIRELMSHPRVVAIGEIGLDYYYQHSSRGEQIAALEAQLQLACDHSLPVSFHVRDAYDDFWPIYDNFRARGVLHSFTDTRATMERALTRNLYIGINGISTFTIDLAQQEMYRDIPLGNILLETDAPFLTPAPYRGKMNTPAYVRIVAEHYARLKEVDFDTVAATTSQTARELFNLSSPDTI